jgi:cell division protein ZapE
MSPEEKYQELLTRNGFSEDPAQRAVVGLFEDLYARLQARERSGSRWWLRLRRGATPPERGLYLWGGVGRGKTLLMDAFYDCLAPEDRLRVHFHRFMQRVHRDLQQLEGIANPLDEVAARFAAESKVLCFDEFFVSDIGDAMILAELLERLFARGVTLVATSNVAPDQLYHNGLQRSRFLPAIALLKQHTRVHELDSGVDYRLRGLERAEIYHWPLDQGAFLSLQRSFNALAVEPAREHVALDIEGRTINAFRVAEDVAWFEFGELCEGPRSQNDYIELARIFHAVLVAGVPVFTWRNEDAARRFISLVDEFYDHDVKLILSAEAGVRELYQGERLRFEFERTASRLLEMQSHEYLARSHRA